MTYNVFSGTLNPTHSLARVMDGLFVRVSDMFRVNVRFRVSVPVMVRVRARVSYDCPAYDCPDFDCPD